MIASCMAFGESSGWLRIIVAEVTPHVFFTSLPVPMAMVPLLLLTRFPVPMMEFSAPE
jgi:hypothetical protein